MSCTSPTVCTAVGDSRPSTTEQSLIEHWDGIRWSIQPIANPAGAVQSRLWAVSCSSATACTAVGGYTVRNCSCDIGPTYYPGAQTLTERWNGTSWSSQRNPTPAGASGFAAGVSCSSSSACVAVGSYSPAGSPYATDLALAERWDGNRWSIQPTLAPNGSLRSASCPTKTVCTAVGSYTSTGGTEATLAERENGTKWSIQRTTNLAGASQSDLTSVSCASSTICIAVGSYTKTGGRSRTLAERWNGIGWSSQRIPDVGLLTGLSCASATACVAVGAALVGHVVSWNGARWSLHAIPKPAGASQLHLNDVSCSAPTACIAVGSSVMASGRIELPSAERWNGTSWSIQPTPKRVDLTYPDSRLMEVSCAVPTDCIAVGYRYGVTGDHGVIRGPLLAERWNGVKWSLEAIPNPAGVATANLTGLSCSAKTGCSLVGSFNNGSGYFVERWNGMRWSTQATVAVTAAKLSLSGVSCTAQTSCTAVGSYPTGDGAQVTLAERWTRTPQTSIRPPTGVPGA